MPLPETPAPQTLTPRAALPGGELHFAGPGMGPGLTATLGGVPALVTLARPGRAIVQVPEDTGSSNPDEPDAQAELLLMPPAAGTIAMPVGLATRLAENLHPVANPAVDALGNLYTTLSGARGQQTPVSVFRIAPRPDANGLYEMRPYLREVMNASGLAFGPDGRLYVSSRAEGTVYRVGSGGVAQVYAEGLGIATGIAFDSAGDLYVGDRSGTVFKIRQGTPAREQETFVFATLEPSIAAFHLAFDSNDTLYVTGPTASSSQTITAISQSGETRVFYRGLGRAQGMAFAPDDTLYVAASLRGERGIVRITQAGEATLVASAPNLVGLCLLRDGRAAVTTRDSLYVVALP